MNESQKFAVMTCEPFEVNGMDDIGSCCLEATLMCLVFNDMFFVFCNLAQLVDFIRLDGG